MTTTHNRQWPGWNREPYHHFICYAPFTGFPFYLPTSTGEGEPDNAFMPEIIQGSGEARSDQSVGMHALHFSFLHTLHNLGEGTTLPFFLTASNLASPLLPQLQKLLKVLRSDHLFLSSEHFSDDKSEPDNQMEGETLDWTPNMFPVCAFCTCYIPA